MDSVLILGSRLTWQCCSAHAHIWWCCKAQLTWLLKKLKHYILHFATIFIALRKPSFNRWNRGLASSFRCWYRQLCGGDCSSTSWRHFERYVSCSGLFCFLFRIELRGRLDSFVWQWSWDRLSPCAPHYLLITSFACSYCYLWLWSTVRSTGLETWIPDFSWKTCLPFDSQLTARVKLWRHCYQWLCLGGYIYIYTLPDVLWIYWVSIYII